MENLSGKNIKGYELLERIGAGGFGAVYKANQSTIGREVAIKIILPHFANHPDFIRRFETEAQLVARLEHLHIVPLFDYWRDPDGAYLVMRWSRGGSLREALDSKPFEIEAAALLLNQIAAALSVAHRNNVIHRDLKPGNILLDEDGNAYLADFGIAKDSSIPGITEVDAIVGSPDYLAPEQASGEEVTPRTDIYSLGVVLYELLTGAHPFPNLNSVERLYKHLSEPLPLITTLSDDVRVGVNTVIQTATAKNPSHRYADAMAMALAFREAIKLAKSDNPVETLTQREQEILSRIIAGMSNQQIASELVITVSTVKWYVNQIFRKLNVRSRVQAIVRARELNLIVSGNGTAVLAPIPTEDFNPENPYKGLQAFQAADNQDFFGREKLVQKLVARLSEASEYARFLAVIGPSGSGKSSLVKAGLIPALWRGDLKGSEKWFIVEMLPGSHPLDELEIALTRVATKPNADLSEQLTRDERGLLRASQLILPDDGSEIVLIIDQFEEVFTLVDDESLCLHFLSLLYAAVTEPRSRVRVIITLRADFYDRPLHYPDFGELMHARIETVLPLSAEGLEQAIARPVERIGAVFEPGLVTTIVSDVHYQPGALPLLQYALTELFERRQGRKLTHEAYQDIGGTVGALAKRAEDIYNELSAEAQHSARQMFLRLVTLGEGTEDTRRRTSRSELLAISEDTEMMDEIIDTFAAYRLLSLDNDPGTRTPTVEVAHEAILREWERLRVWLNESREEIRLQRQLTNMAEEWRAANRESSFLAHGARLEQFEQWVAGTQLALTQREQQFLHASLAEREQRDAAEAERQARETRLEQRSQTFLRGLIVVLLLAMFGAFGLTGIAVENANNAQVEREHAESQALIAEQERERAEQQARIAQTRELVGYASSSLETDAELSTLLALQAVNTTYAVDGTVLPEAETVLHQAVQQLNTPLRLEAAEYPASEMHEFAFTPDDSRIAYYFRDFRSGEAPLMAITDSMTGEILYTIEGFPLAGQIVDNRLGTWGFEEEQGHLLDIWDISSSEAAVRLDPVPLPLLLNETVDAVTISPDLRFFVKYGQRNGTQVFELSKGEEIVIPGLDARHRGDATFSSRGNLLSNRAVDGSLQIFSVSDWTELYNLSLPGARIVHWAFSGDERYVATANTDNSIGLWDLSTGREQFFPTDFAPTVVSISSDGTRVAAASVTGETAVWDTSNGREIARLSVSHVNNIKLNSDGTRLATQQSGSLHVWDVLPGREYLTMVNNPILDVGASGLAYSPDGTRLVVASMSTEANVWDAHTGQRVFSLSGHSARVGSAAWSPDGTTIASAGEDTDVILWRAADGQERLKLSGHTGEIYGLAFSPDSRRIASSGFDQTVRIWDVETGESLLRLDQPAASKGVAFSPDGTRIAAGTDRAGAEGYVRIWDSRTGEMHLEIPVGDTRTGAVVFSADGSRLLVGLQDVWAALVIDARTGEILMSLTGHVSTVAGAAYSPDGTLIATGGFIYDASIRLWESTTGQERLRLFAPSGVARVAFSPDGKYLATHTIDGTTRVYVVALPDLIALAESRLTRWWTPEECQRYLHTDTCPAGAPAN